MDTTKPEITTILMLPWLAHGHISPFLELAKRLSHKKFHIYFCSTPVNLNPIRQNLDHQNSNSLLFSSNSIQLIDLHLPDHSFPELPPHYHTTKDLPPHLMSTLKTAFDAAKPSFSSILHTLKPDLVIYDFLQPWVPVAANELNIPAIVFLSSSASTYCFLLHHCSENSSGTKYPFPGFDFPEAECQKLTQFMEDVANGMTTNDRFLGCMAGSSGIVLIKTSREIEGKYIDHLSVLAGKEVVPVGPLVQDHDPMKTADHVEAEIMEWLSKKEPSSTVFVSFGSEYFPPKAEIEEVALGLELSEVNFIWVVRFHGEERIKIHEALPKGFLERVGERGFVVENWAPQVKILGHESIGGFVSHCGWSSALEGMIFGVPIIAMAMQLDQPLNAKLVVDIGVGVEVQRQNIDEKLEREEVARVIREVVVQEQGEDVRRKAKELKEKMKMKGDGEIDAVVQKLIQLVPESNEC